MSKSVYVETSVVSARVTLRDDPVSEAQRFHTVEWWTNYRLFYDVCYSQAVNEVDYLLTWNCKHLANVNKIEHIQVINRRLGLLTPVILTPEMLLSGDNQT